MGVTAGFAAPSHAVAWRRRLPARFAVVALTLAALIASGCLGSDNPGVQLTVDGGNPPPPRSAGSSSGSSSAPTAVPFSPTVPPSDLDPEDLHGFVMPIEDACYPGLEESWPNAPREALNHVNDGVDFYWGDSCVLIERGTAVVAAYGGVVVRVDHEFVPLTFDEVTKLRERLADGRGAERGDAAGEGAAGDEADWPDEETLDRLRGRQVWIDHGNGVVTRYAQLARVTADLAEGVYVPQGHRIGGVGESGMPDSLTAPGSQLHLHWEVRVGDSYLGADADAETVRALYQRLMEPSTDD